MSRPSAMSYPIGLASAPLTRVSLNLSFVVSLSHPAAGAGPGSGLVGGTRPSARRGLFGARTAWIC
jgi:hypothetical protein